VAGDRRGVKSIFDEAAEIGSPEERAAFLERACGGDADVRRQVEALLRALDQAGSFLEAPPTLDTVETTEASVFRSGLVDPPEPESTSAQPFEQAGCPIIVAPLAESPGTMIGSYKLLQRIGEGGMGAVFMAEQEKPVRRKVALKVIKPGMDTRQVIARFEAERQALAMMDHPNIARVLDAGATETGRPFFVMELVKGVPITEYCDANHLTPRERLELFIPVCQAIQHAHQKGIIHRDLKPSNVLVTLHDGNPAPKVIDFGVAKAIDQRLTERTLFTEIGAVIGTLEYMSPEQAEMGALDIDTRTDIYSLGVMLYELLTGSTPLERAKIREAAYGEILRRIREEEPTRPSTRLSESRDAQPSISAQRKMDPARLARFVRGDVDWIVMKALEKDRTRRYETATGFARDVRRYLDGDLVEACPPSTSYKLRKFARKHRVALTTVGSVVVILVAATMVSVGLALWADHERVRAVKAEGKAKAESARAFKAEGDARAESARALKAEGEAKAESARAVKAEGEAKAESAHAIKAEGEAKADKARAVQREQLAIDAVKQFSEVIRESSELKNEPKLAPLRAKLLKEPQEFFKRLRDRLQIDKEASRNSLDRLGAANFELAQLTSDIGDRQDAVASFKESLAIRERLVREYPTVTRFRSDLALTYRNMGAQQRLLSQLVDAVDSWKKASALCERLVDENPDDIRLRIDLAWSLQGAAADLNRIDRFDEAMEVHERARSLYELLAKKKPSDTKIQQDLAACYNFMGRIQMQQGRPADALVWHERSRRIRDRLVRARPSNAGFQRDLALSHYYVGGVHDRMGRPAEALAAHERARVIRERLARDQPSVTWCGTELAETYDAIYRLQNRAGRRAEAKAALEGARAVRDRLLVEHPGSNDFAASLATTLHDLASIDLDEHRFDKAHTELLRASELRRKLLAAEPNNSRFRRQLDEHLTLLIRASDELGRADDVAQATNERSALRDSGKR
jgi:eukaryotic-like serine/threonine-protein kinase